MIQNIEDVSTVRLRKMLGSVKRALNVKMGAISKMKKPELLNKITELKYKWNPEKQQLTTNSMIRKKSVVDLPPRVVRKPKPLTQEKKVKLLKKMVSDFSEKKKNEINKLTKKRFELNKVISRNRSILMDLSGKRDKTAEMKRKIKALQKKIPADEKKYDTLQNQIEKLQK